MMNKSFLCSLFVVVWIMNLARPVLGGSEPPASFLSASEVLELYSSMYSSVHNMSVSYMDVVEEIIPDPKYPNALDNLVRYERVERIEEGDKYHIRYSTDAHGFERPDEIMEHAFDGSVTMEYFSQNKSGSIDRGRTGRNVERMNALLEYMLLNRTHFRPDSKMRERYPNGAPFIELMVSPQGTVRPHLERIAGEWCHVVDTYRPGHPKPAITIWFAAEKGGLQMKFEQHDRQGKCTRSIVVEKVAVVDNKGDPFWYPQEAISISNRSLGTVKHRFVCHELRVNVETSKDTWKFSFPVGAQVVDRILGIYYVVGSGETPGGEPMVLGTLDSHGITGSTTPEAEDGGAHLGGDEQDVSKASTEPKKAEVQSGRGTEGPIAVTNTGRKQFGLVAVVLCLSALLACGGGIFLWKRNAGRAIEKS